MDTYYVYIITNVRGNVMHVGTTNDLERRLAEHRGGEISGFTSMQQAHKLVYCEEFQSVEEAIAREKQIKG